MDKNMINIDDFVRQRLSGGEEKERAGAWLHMRDLLDDKMPLRPAAGGYNWRRMLTAATGLVLLASLTVGGYKMYTGFRMNEPVQTGAPSDVAYTLPQNNATPSEQNTPAPALPTSNQTLPESKKSHSLTTDKTPINTSKKTTPPTLAASPLPTKNPLAEPVNSETEPIPTKNISIKTQAGTISPTTTKTPTNTIASTHNMSPKLPSNTHATAANHSAPPHSSSPTPPSSAPENRNQTPATIAATNDNNAKATEEKANKNEAPSIGTAQTIPTKNKTGSESLKQPNETTKQPATAKDSMPQIAVREKMNVDPIRKKATAFRDTTSIGKIAVENRMASAATVPQSAAPTPSINAAAASKTEASAKSVTSKKAHRTSFLNAERMKEMLLETQYRLGQVKINIGITGGINNYLYGTSNMMGIHIGPRITAEFDEKWSLFAEPKYMQRFNKSYIIKDNYWKVGNVVGNEYRASEIEHFFKFSALHTIEMPIAVRYALFKQLHIFAGGNLVYNFKINAEEITHVSEERSYTGSSFGLQYQPSVRLDHFGSRFSAGYLFGLSLQVTPTFDIDARLIKNFWDNAAGSGPRKISDQLLYRPSLQLSIGYKFPQRNKIPPAK